MGDYTIAICLVISVIFIVIVVYAVARRCDVGVDLSMDALEKRHKAKMAKELEDLNEEHSYYYDWLFGRLCADEDAIKKLLSCPLMRSVDYNALQDDIAKLKRKNKEEQQHG